MRDIIGGGVCGAAIAEIITIIIYSSIIVIDIDVVTVIGNLRVRRWYGITAFVRILFRGGLRFLLSFLTSFPFHTTILKPYFYLEHATIVEI